MNTLATMLSNWFFRASLNMMGYGNGPWDLSRLHQTFYATLVEKVNRLFTMKETDANDIDDQERTALHYQRLSKSREAIRFLINPQSNLEIVADGQNQGPLYMADGPTAFDSLLDEENSKESQRSKIVTENLVQKISIYDLDSGIGKSKNEELPPTEPVTNCTSCIESKAPAVHHSMGNKFKQPVLPFKEPRRGERGASCANGVNVVTGDSTSNCRTDAMKEQVALDSEVKNDQELQYREALKERSVETTCNQDGGDFEKPEGEYATKYAVNSVSVERFKCEIAEKTQCKTLSDKITGARLQLENLNIGFTSCNEGWLEGISERDGDAKYQAQKIRKMALKDELQEKFLSKFEKTQEEVQFLRKENEQLLKENSKLVLSNLNHSEVLESNIAHEIKSANEHTCVVGLRDQQKESMGIIELRDKEIRKLAFRNELMGKLMLKREAIETEVIMLKQKKESLLQENVKAIQEVEEKNDALKQYEIKMVKLESHIARLETNLSEIKKSHEDMVVFQQPSSNSKEQFEGVTKSTRALHETSHRSIEDSDKFVFQCNVETIDTISGKGILPGDQQHEFHITGSGCEQVIERNSKLCEDTSAVCSNGVAQDKLQEERDKADADYLHCKGKDGLQARLNATEPYNLEKGSIIASALFDDLCNQLDSTAGTELCDRKHKWRQKALAIEASAISDLEEGILSADHIMRRNSIFAIQNQGLWELVDVLLNKNRVLGNKLLEFSKKLNVNDSILKVGENLPLSEKDELNKETVIAKNDRKKYERGKVLENENNKVLRNSCEGVDHGKIDVGDPEDELIQPRERCKAIEAKQSHDKLIDYLKIELKELRKNVNDLEIKNDKLHGLNDKLVGENKKLGKQNRRLRKNLKDLDTPKVENLDCSIGAEKLSATSINPNYISKNIKEEKLSIVYLDNTRSIPNVLHYAAHESGKNVNDKLESRLQIAEKELFEWQEIGEFIRGKCDGKQKEQYKEALKLDIIRQWLISLFGDYDQLKCTENLVKQQLSENEALRQRLAVVVSKNTELGNQLSKLALRERQFCEVKKKLSRVSNEKRLLECDVQQLTQRIIDWEGWYYSHFERM